MQWRKFGLVHGKLESGWIAWFIGQPSLDVLHKRRRPNGHIKIFKDIIIDVSLVQFIHLLISIIISFLFMI